MTAHRHRQLFLLVSLLLLATFVRMNGILAQSLWIDEGFTWNLTQYHDVFAILRQDVHPPLYFLMIDAWVELTGTSVFSMRYFSLLPSLLSVAVVYQLARERTHGPTVFCWQRFQATPYRRSNWIRFLDETRLCVSFAIQ